MVKFSFKRKSVDIEYGWHYIYISYPIWELVIYSRIGELFFYACYKKKNFT